MAPQPTDCFAPLYSLHSALVTGLLCPWPTELLNSLVPYFFPMRSKNRNKTYSFDWHAGGWEEEGCTLRPAVFISLRVNKNSYEINTEDVKNNHYIQMQITSIEDECYTKYCTRLFHTSFLHLILKPTFKVGISHVYWQWINWSPECLRGLIETA